jgi:2-polyprenyl-3-methyl-5-hydroxy-6-metoxy-1,4-benzoquinol methylase
LLDVLQARAHGRDFGYTVRGFAMNADPKKALQRSWVANAEGWTRAVREGRIESRRVATDAAIVEAILEHSPRRVLDVGCGEGWLVRSLAERGITAVGVDASSPLIEAARSQGGGTFHRCSYAEIVADAEPLGPGFDAVVFNFALLEEDALPVLRAARRLLVPSGSVFIQTVHPWTARGGESYRNGWRIETFTGFGPGFSEPMPWYFRTLQSWVSLLHQSGLRIREIREPLHPDGSDPLSLLIIGTPLQRAAG